MATLKQRRALVAAAEREWERTKELRGWKKKKKKYRYDTTMHEIHKLRGKRGLKSGIRGR